MEDKNDAPRKNEENSRGQEDDVGERRRQQFILFAYLFALLCRLRQSSTLLILWFLGLRLSGVIDSDGECDTEQ